MNKEVKEILKLISNCYYCNIISYDKKEKYCNYITSLEEKLETEHKAYMGTVKEMYMNKEKAVQWQYYIDGNDNAFNCLLGKIERR